MMKVKTNIHPEGTSLYIKADKGDKDNINSFMSMSDNEKKRNSKKKELDTCFESM